MHSPEHNRYNILTILINKEVLSFNKLAEKQVSVALHHGKIWQRVTVLALEGGPNQRPFRKGFLH